MKKNEKGAILPPWEIKLRRTENGFILSYLEEMIGEKDDKKDYYIKREIVFEDGAFIEELSQYEGVPLKSIRDLNGQHVSIIYALRAIADHFGCGYNKHVPVNIQIGLENLGED